MKKLLLAVTVLFVLSLCSCTKVVYSHKAVMEKYHAKQDVRSAFGFPSEIRKDGAMEEWLYNFGAAPSNYSLDSSNAALLDSARITNRTVTEFNTYDKYVKFTFNPDSTVKSWHSKGVDYTERKKKKGATAVITVLGVAAVLLVVGGIVAQSALSGL